MSSAIVVRAKKDPTFRASLNRDQRSVARNAVAIVGLSLAAAGTAAACSGQAPAGESGESVGATSEALLTCSTASLYTVGDFNGDGKQDIIITNSSTAPFPGSYWFISNGDGTWKTSYVRTDLTLENTQYVVGDFNKDHLDDVLIYVAGTSYLYISKGDGTFTPNVWFGALTPVAVGDFNGDGKKDLVATGAGHSTPTIYLSNFTGTSGSWNTAWGQTPGASSGNVRYTVGNFDGATSSTDDLVVTSDSGTTVYYSSGSGTWTAGMTRPDLTLDANVFFKAADFNGDRNDDLVISAPSGSWWYFSNGTNHNFTQNVYVRGDLPIDGYSGPNGPTVGTAILTSNNPTYPTNYQFVDLDGDGLKDMVIQNVAGTTALLSRSSGASAAWTQAWSLGPGEYIAAADFNHDHASDVLVEDSTGTHGFFSSIPQGIRSCIPGQTCPPNFPTYTAKPDTGTPLWSRPDLAVNNMQGVGFPYPYWGQGGAPAPGNLFQPECFSEWDGPCLNEGCNAGLQCVTPGGSEVGGTNVCASICPGLAAGDCCLPNGACAGIGLACVSGVCEPSCAGGGAIGQPCCGRVACAVGNTCVPQTDTCETKACGTNGARCCTSEGSPQCGSGLACEPGNPPVCKPCGAQGEACCAGGCSAGLACNSSDMCEVPSTCVGFAGGGTEGNACCPGNECAPGLSCHSGCVGFATPICTAGCVNGGTVGGGGGTCNVAGDVCCVNNGVPVCGTQGNGAPLFCCNSFCQTNPSCPL